MGSSCEEQLGSESVASGWRWGGRRQGPGFSQLGVSGFAMKAGLAALHMRCGLSGLNGWAWMLCGPDMFLCGDGSLGKVTIRDSGQCGHR